MIKVRPEAIQKERVEPYFAQWEELSLLIHQAHDQRSGEAKTLMEKGISLFEECVVNSSYCNEQTVNENEEYEVLPINGMERLSFIKARPGQYACYRQLDELFKELKKRLARLRIKS
ncbi:hypothetical protein H9636_00845 [Ureibacillus sp. Re31]|uniref:YpoC-like domain-containing protein n=1 Tax=Ureibacillus galli TaxID=2762222 RepID=A0ABR8X8Q5_9BACL|nr:hypothetical protein [Ureibacillus galli]MBD8025191.1 hypothetical protein [Ureibacillus galli]